MRAKLSKRYSRYVFAAFYVLAGINHFIRPQFYLEIMPAIIPWPKEMVYISGGCEILGGLLVLHHKTRRAGAWFVILLLLAIFPANVQMAINFSVTHNPHLWVAILRLPLQALLIWWAAIYTRKETVERKGYR
ncbi:MAG: DoxX family protein [Bacteroidota bacterium]